MRRFAWFAIDVRSAAAFRAALGGLLLLDLGFRLPDFGKYYTDAGYYPVSLAREASTIAGLWPHLWNGEVFLQGTLLLFQAAAAALFAFGVRPRISGAAALFLLLSLHQRNPLILYGFDTLLVWLLFWGLFLPLDTNKESGSPLRQVSSWGTVAFFAQTVLFYLQNAASKLAHPGWSTGESIVFAMSEGRFQVMGEFFARHPSAAAWIGYAVMLVEFAAPALLLIPFHQNRFRLWALGPLAALHGSILVFLRLELFPAASLVGLLPFLPSVFWGDRGKTPEAGPMRPMWPAGLFLGWFAAAQVGWISGAVTEVFRFSSKARLYARPEAARPVAYIPGGLRRDGNWVPVLKMSGSKARRNWFLSSLTMRPDAARAYLRSVCLEEQGGDDPAVDVVALFEIRPSRPPKKIAEQACSF